MLRALAVFTLALTGADHWTTWICLRAPVEGWLVTEANPVADWLFRSLGLANGLAVDSLVTLAAVVFLVRTPSFERSVKMGLMAIIACSTAYAVGNNLHAIVRMGVSPWGGPL